MTYSNCYHCGQACTNLVVVEKEHTTMKGDIEIDVVTERFYCSQECANEDAEPLNQTI